MARTRKVVYPPAKTATKGAPAGIDPRAAANASRAVSIDLNAIKGSAAIQAGARVEIASGLYAGEIATVEAVVGGVIHAAVVRTDAGRTRRVRTVDLRPVTAPDGGSGTAGGQPAG